MEPTIRIELMTSSLPWMRSTIWAMRALFPNKLWSGWWESNPRDQLGRLEFYHWTTPAFNSKYHLYIQFHGGGRRIRTSEGWAVRFTVWSLWPLGNPSTKTGHYSENSVRCQPLNDNQNKSDCQPRSRLAMGFFNNHCERKQRIVYYLMDIIYYRSLCESLRHERPSG